MHKKIILTTAFIISLLPVFLNQFGSCRGVQEVMAIGVVLSPIGIFSITMYLIGLYYGFKSQKTSFIFSIIGLVGIVISEIYQLLTWNYPNTSYIDNFRNCFTMVYPEFYFGVISSIIMIIVYLILNKKFSNNEKIYK
ncbi:MAG: hypothetical protein RSA08_02855 [Clostridia bacterium]